MNRTKNELADYAWNPVTGCLKDCRYCYARKSAIRFASDWRRNLAERPKVQQVGEKLFELGYPLENEEPALPEQSNGVSAHHAQIPFRLAAKGQSWLKHYGMHRRRFIRAVGS